MAKDAKGHGSDSRGQYQGPSQPGKMIVGGRTFRTGYDNLRAKAEAAKAGADETRRAFQDKFGNTGGTMVSRSGGQPVVGNAAAAHELSSGSPKSDAAPVHDSMTHNDQGHAWGSPEALKDFKDKYNAGRAAGRAKNLQDFGPRNHAAEQRGFNSGKREINRLRKQGK